MPDAPDPFPDLPAPGPEAPSWQPTRDAGLERLAAFLPRSGRRYAEDRNFDHGPADRRNVSGLSPWIRHRLVREDEVVEAVLGQHSYSAAEKFLQEVLWRTYWKGWLEQRPGVTRGFFPFKAAIPAALRRLGLG